MTNDRGPRNNITPQLDVFLALAASESIICWRHEAMRTHHGVHMGRTLRLGDADVKRQQPAQTSPEPEVGEFGVLCERVELLDQYLCQDMPAE